jgi:hypothetical protein
MSTENDVARSLGSWLKENRHEDANRVLDVVFDQIPATPQRRAGWLARRFPIMSSNVFRVGIAAVVAITAILGLSYLNTQVGSRQPTPTPIPSGLRVPLPSSGALVPGTYVLANPCVGACSDYQRIVFSLPPGWATRGGLVYKHLNQPDEVAFSAWIIDQVYDDPCHWQTSTLSPLDLGDHTHDASGAIVFLGPRDGGLAHQAGRNASALTQVTLGGEIALKIELSVPAQLGLASCDNGEYRSWTEWLVADGANSHNAPGQIDVVYMVDVDRRPFVIDASHMPGTSAEDLAELDQILATLVIER